MFKNNMMYYGTLVWYQNKDTPSYCIVVLMAPQRTDIHIIPHILGFRLVEETNDDVLKMEMDPLIESLTVSGQHVLLATQKLSIQPEIIEHREELIEATRNVLVGVVKVTCFVVKENSCMQKS